MIGNESWNTDSYNGYATAKEYATDIVEFSKAMKSVDPSIKIIVNGNNAPWWSQVLSNASSYIDYLAVSNYPVDHYYKGYSFYLNKSIYLMNEVDIAVNAIHSYAKEKDKKRLKVIVTEFNSIDYSNEWKNRNDLGHGLMTFEILGEQLKNPKVEGNYFWNTRWITNETDPYSLDDAVTKDGKLTAAGKALSIWGNNLLDSMIYTTSTSLLRSFASIDKDGKTLSLFIVNKDQKNQPTKIQFQHLKLNSILKYQALIGKSADDTDPVFKYLTDIKLVGDSLEVDLQPFSISVIHLQLK
jgi:alpha-L-arabinofuranosidase